MRERWVVLATLLAGCTQATTPQATTPQATPAPPNAHGLGASAAWACIPAAPVLNHIGIFVRSLDDTLAMYRSMGFPPAAERGFHSVKQYGVAVVHLGNTHLEFLSAEVGKHPFVSEWIAKHGEGIHHMAFETPDIRATAKCLVRSGIKLDSRFPEPIAGATGWVSFTDPSSTGSVNIEFVQPFAKPGLWAETGALPQH